MANNTVPVEQNRKDKFVKWSNRKKRLRTGLNGSIDPTNQPKWNEPNRRPNEWTKISVRQRKNLTDQADETIYNLLNK